MAAYTGERLLLTLWVGSLWAIGYLAVPMAFATLDSTLAGEYAGRLFFSVNVIGIVSGLILLVSRFFALGVSRFRAFWRSWMLLLMLFICLLFAAFIQPEMASIKQMPFWQQDELLSSRFSSLHFWSENLYLLLSLFGLFLVLTTDKTHETDGQS